LSAVRYWREARFRGRLVGVKCRGCGKVFYPPRKVCRICRSKDLSEEKLPERGKIISFTIIRTSPKGYERFQPYTVGLIRLENGVQILSQIADCHLNEVKIGMDVEATFRRLKEDEQTGLIEYGYKFRPLRSEPPKISAESI